MTARAGVIARFRRDITGRPAAMAAPMGDLPEDGTYELVAAPVREHIGATEVRLLAYNGSGPGPTLQLR